MKKIKIDLNYLLPMKSLIYPLFSDEGEKILDARVVLTPEIISEIKGKYGNIVYYNDPENYDVIIPGYRLNTAFNGSKQILDEILHSDKISKDSYRKAEKIVEEIIQDLDFSEAKILNLLKDLKKYDDYLYQHHVNVGILSALYAKKLKTLSPDELKYLTLGAYLHDIGTIKIDQQLLKKKGKYDITEMQKMKRHPQLGYEILKDISGINPIVLQTVLFHHEKFNNRGYYNLPYENMSIFPKIVSICDTFDALTSKRPFRDALTPSEALKIIVNLTNIQFSYKEVTDFINYISPLINDFHSFYSKSDFVELNTKEIAIVKDFNIYNYLKPKVMIFCKFENLDNKVKVKFYNDPIEIDLEKDMNRYMTKIINNQKQINSIKLKLLEKNLYL